MCLTRPSSLLKFAFNWYTKLLRQVSIRTPPHSIMSLKYLNQEEAIAIDQELFNEYMFSVDQLMELAGLSVATALHQEYPTYSHVLIACGPGNNGGDGLVAARHLTLFGYKVTVVYPKRGKGDLFDRLVTQCEKSAIPVMDKLPDDVSTYDRELGIVVDAVFGFSYKPPCRPNFKELLRCMSNLQYSKLVSVDVPSGWIIDDEGHQKDEDTPVLDPDCLVSLTGPKVCSKNFTGVHYLGGRFVPPALEAKHQLNLPSFPSHECVVKL